MNVSVDKQKLVFKGKTLVDTSKIGEYLLEEGEEKSIHNFRFIFTWQIHKILPKLFREQIDANWHIRCDRLFNFIMLENYSFFWCFLPIKGAKVHLVVSKPTASVVSTPSSSSAATSTKSPDFWPMLTDLLRRHFNPGDVDKIIDEYKKVSKAQYFIFECSLEWIKIHILVLLLSFVLLHLPLRFHEIDLIILSF